MEKLLVNVYVPALMQSFDLFVPQEVEIQKVISLMADGVAELSRGRFQISGKELLMRDGAKKPFFPQKKLYEYDVLDGERLILI